MKRLVMMFIFLTSTMATLGTANAHEGEFTCACKSVLGKYTGTNAELHCTVSGVQNKDNPSFPDYSWIPLEIHVTEDGKTAMFPSRARASLTEDRVSGSTWKDVGMSIEKWEEYFTPFSKIECNVSD